MVEFSKPNEHTSNLRPEENYQEEAVEKLFDTEVVDDIGKKKVRLYLKNMSMKT